MKYLGVEPGYRWYKPATSNMQPLQDIQILDDPKNGLHDLRSFVGACNLYLRHLHNFTYSSAPLTDHIRKTNRWRRTDKEEACSQEFRRKISSTNSLGVHRPKGGIMLVTDACDAWGVVPYDSCRSLTPLRCHTANFTLQV